MGVFEGVGREEGGGGLAFFLDGDAFLVKFAGGRLESAFSSFLGFGS